MEEGGFIGGVGTLRENWFVTTVCSSDRVVIASFPSKLMLKSAKRVNRVSKRPKKKQMDGWMIMNFGFFATT